MGTLKANFQTTRIFLSESYSDLFQAPLCCLLLIAAFFLLLLFIAVCFLLLLLIAVCSLLLSALKMSNIVSGGKPFASSHQNASTVESKAFTGLQGNYWASKELSATKTKENSIDEWIGYEFNEPKTVKQFSFKGDPVKELNAPSSYTFEGSSDGKEWKVLFNVEPGKDKGKEFKTVDEKRVHEVKSPEAFKFYRLHVTNNGNSKQGRGAHVIAVADFQMFA